MKRVLILGASGMLGHMLIRKLSANWQVAATVRAGSDGLVGKVPWFANIDLYYGVDAMHPDTLVPVFLQAKPDFVVNAIGIIKQREEARDAASCIAVNALFPHLLFRLCQLRNSKLIQISTDCVFSGTRGMYKEDDVPDPVDLYDKTKLLGEVKLPGALTLRTSLFGRELARAYGLIEWFLANRGGSVHGYSNVVFSGMSTAAFATTLGLLMSDFAERDGLYHVGADPISKYQLLCDLNSAAQLDIDVIAAQNPVCNRSLQAEAFWTMLGVEPPTWEEMTRETAAEIEEYDRLRPMM